MVTHQFLITSLMVVLIPGTGVLFTVSTGLVAGRTASIFAALGCTAGIVPHLLATVLGFAAVLHASAIAFQALKIAGVIYLLYLAYATWKDKTAFVIENAASGRSATNFVVKAFLLNILNPKLTIFFLAFLPQFVEPNARSPFGQMLILSGVFMAMTFAIFVVYGFLAHAFRKTVIDSPRTQSWLLEGRFIIDLEDKSVELAERQGLVVPKGVVHRTRAPERAVILMVETAAIIPTGDA